MTAVENYNFSDAVAANLWSYPVFAVAHVGATTNTQKDRSALDAGPAVEDIPEDRRADREVREFLSTIHVHACDRLCVFKDLIVQGFMVSIY